MRKSLIITSALLLGVSLAHAQVAPTQMGVTSAVPNVVQVLDATRNWATIGTVNPTTHVFTPTGGSGIPDAPNDATLYGRKSLAWSHITHNDITDWSASVPAATPPGGATGTIQYNNAGAFGGFTASGDATINTATGAVAVTKTGGTAFGALATVTPGTGVAAALGVATNANGGVALANTGLTNGNFVKWAAGGLVDGGAGGTSIIFPQAVSGTVNSGGVPYFSAAGTMSSSAALAANALMVGGGAGVAPSTITTGSGVVPALGVAANGTGAISLTTSPTFVTPVLGTPTSVTLTNATGLPISSGVSGLGTGVAAALAANLNASAGVASAAAPLSTGTGGTITVAYGYYICTAVCTVTLPTPAAGFQFCIRNDQSVTSVITIAAIASVSFEKTTYNGYGTAGSGTMVSGGALGDKICLIGRDATHYLVGSFVGTWTNS